MTTDQAESKRELPPADPSASEADRIRATESNRLRALVEANVEVVRQLHADDFQLINPSGGVTSKEQYLAAVASGEIDYRVWDLDSPIDVRLHGDMAIIRYRSQIEAVIGGRPFPLRRYWHTDSYEKHDVGWQVVWSHATEIR